jgi:glycerol-3-phosphate acyltransferase PlsY
MSPRGKHFWLALALLPFVVPLVLLTVWAAAVSLPSFFASSVLARLIGDFWWLILIITVFVDWLAYLIHAQHAPNIPDDSRKNWTLLLFLFAPFTNLFYYGNFIAREETRNA